MSCNSTSPAWSPARTSRPRARTPSRMATAQPMARRGPSKVARVPSPVLLTCRPRNRSSWRRTKRSYPSSSSFHRRSPSSAARAVEPTMSVNITVVRTRSDAIIGQSPVRKDCIWARTASRRRYMACADRAAPRIEPLECGLRGSGHGPHAGRHHLLCGAPGSAHESLAARLARRSRAACAPSALSSLGWQSRAVSADPRTVAFAVGHARVHDSEGRRRDSPSNLRSPPGDTRLDGRARRSDSPGRA